MRNDEHNIKRQQKGMIHECAVYVELLIPKSQNFPRPAKGLLTIAKGNFGTNTLKIP
jgi:hypothetical protein